MYQIKGKVSVYGASHLADESGHLATCESMDIAEAIAAALNAQQEMAEAQGKKREEMIAFISGAK